jgi:hypothetical protein
MRAGRILFKSRPCLRHRMTALFLNVTHVGYFTDLLSRSGKNDRFLNVCSGWANLAELVSSDCSRKEVTFKAFEDVKGQLGEMYAHYVGRELGRGDEINASPAMAMEEVYSKVCFCLRPDSEAVAEGLGRHI